LAFAQYFCASRRGQGADKVRIAVPEPKCRLPYISIGAEKGFLAAEGFEAEVVLMRGTLDTGAKCRRY
jgi:hypothetical protein